MNKKTIILLSSIALVLIAYFLLNRNISNTLTGDDKNFAYSNTTKIDKIFITNKSSKEYVTLKKTDEKNWVVNDKYKASNSQIELLLETMRKLKVKKPVGKAELEPVIKNMSLNGTKVEVYENGKISKVFYVGGNTYDELGTYFYMENAKEPYVCHIPGFVGFLNTRFFTNLNAWRSKVIFDHTPEQIKTIDVNWTEQPQNSYTIDNQSSSPSMSANGKVYSNPNQINLNLLRSYLALWENLCYEGFPIDLNPKIIDSIANKTNPILVITLTDKNNQKTTMQVHRKGLKKDSYQQMDNMGNPLDFEMENFYAFINGNKTEIVQIQDFVFGKVMKVNKDFQIK